MIGIGDLFDVVEIEVGSRCNRRCSYCPVATDPHPPVPVRMSDEIYDTLLDQLEAIQFSGRLSYHFYNEPLLRLDLELLAARAAESVPGALQILYTNGDRLTDERYQALRRAGIDYFVVTQHDNDSYVDRPFQTVQTGEALVLTNRGGVVDGLPEPATHVGTLPCYAPSEMLIVTVTGDVVLCYEDARRETVMGNILLETIDVIWRSERFSALRRALALGRRQVLPMCQSCSNTAHVEPGRSVVDEPLAFDRRGGHIGRDELKERASLARVELLRKPPQGR